MDTSIELIAKERQRQINDLGYSAEYLASTPWDYADGELGLAAACYATPAENRASDDVSFVPTPDSWPWGGDCWNPSPSNRILELAKAGALIAAEIDRINYLNAHK